MSTFGQSNTLGKLIASGINNTEALKEDVFPTDFDERLLIAPLNTVRIAGSVIVTKKVYDEDALVWNHPVYGDLNVFRWNATYDDTQDEVLFSTNN